MSVKVYSCPCPLCDRFFTQKSELERHLQRKTLCRPLSDNLRIKLEKVRREFGLNLGKTYFCAYCHVHFRRSDVLDRHYGVCPDRIEGQILETTPYLTKQLEKLQPEIVSLDRLLAPRIKPTRPVNRDQSPKIKPCPTGENNLLYWSFDDHENIYHKLEMYMRYWSIIERLSQCAIGTIHADVTIIAESYQDKPEIPVFAYFDHQSKIIRYLNSYGQWICESVLVFMGILCQTLIDGYQKSYEVVLDHHSKTGSLCFGLQERDLLKWRLHMYNLGQISYQRQLLGLLTIPTRTQFDTAMNLARAKRINDPSLPDLPSLN